MDRFFGSSQNGTFAVDSGPEAVTWLSGIGTRLVFNQGFQILAGETEIETNLSGIHSPAGP
jgi:hypothetical protein